MQHAKNQPGSFMHLEIRVPHIHIFYHSDPGVLKVVLTFLQFTSVCNKSAQFIHSFIHSPCDQCATTISDHTQANIFLSTLNFWYQHVKKCRLSSLCSRYIFDLKSFSLIGQYQFDPVWMRNDQQIYWFYVWLKNDRDKKD